MPSAPLLIDISSRHQVYLEGLKTRESNEAQVFLKKLDRDIRKRLSNTELTEFSRARLERLLETVKRDIKVVMAGHASQVKRSAEELAAYEAEFEAKAMGQVLEHEFVVPSVTQLKAAIYTNPLSAPGIDGNGMLESFLDSFSERTQQRIASAIRLGYYQGETTNQILQRVRGTRARGFRDGIIGRTSADSKTIVRTALQHAASQARNETWQQNSDVVKKVRITATLDSRTSDICRSLDGREYPLDKGPRPPFHPNCRTSTTAVFDQRLSVLKEGATRFSRDPNGDVEYVPAKTNYYSWLKNQPAEFQDSVLGPTRGKLLREGGLPAGRFAELQLGKNFRPLTLEEMRKLEPVAFKKAGV